MFSSNYSTPSEYAIAFEKLFERSGGDENELRAQYAETIYTELGNGSITSNTTTNLFNNNNVVWWGDILITIFAILLVVMGVIFLGLAVTSNEVGSKLISKLKGG